MKKVLITGAGSYIDTKVQNWLEQYPDLFQVDAVDTIDNHWKLADFSQYDVVYNVAGIAHVKAAKGGGSALLCHQQGYGNRDCQNG